MDRGAWQAIVHGVTESDTTELLTLHSAILDCLKFIFCNFEPFICIFEQTLGMVEPGVLQSVGSQRVTHDLAIEQQTSNPCNLGLALIL